MRHVAQVLYLNSCAPQLYWKGMISSNMKSIEKTWSLQTWNLLERYDLFKDHVYEVIQNIPNKISKGTFSWGENRVENGIFHSLVQERKQERQKIRRKIFPLGPPFFILPIWEENGEKKMLNDVLYTNILTLFISHTSHFFNECKFAV